MRLSDYPCRSGCDQESPVTFVLADRILWDFWFAPRPHGGPYHLFYLQAPRTLDDPEERHAVATVGHAVSDDLVRWSDRPIAFEAGPAGAWDDRAIWTGSMLEHNGTFYWFYTAHNHREYFVQRVGLATSTDPNLERWVRHPANPLLEADPRWYEKGDPDQRRAEACRDPWVLRGEGEDPYWYMVYTARANGGSTTRSQIAASPEQPIIPADGRGVIGFARSRDLIAWEPLPPVSDPGDFGDLEVPQPIRLGDRWYLLFCTAKHSAARLAWTGPDGRWMGTHYLVADRVTGPWRLSTDEPLLADEAGTYYAGRIVDGPTGAPVLLAWRQWDDAGRFLGGLSNPAPVSVLADGRLAVDRTALWSGPAVAPEPIGRG